MTCFTSILSGLAVLLYCTLGPAVYADVIAETLWDDAGENFENWDWTGETYVGFTDQDSGGADGGYLQINFADRGVGEAETVVYTDASTLFAGDWTDELWVEFDFWSEDSAPDYLELRFQSSEAGSEMWSYLLTPPSPAAGWSAFSAAFAWSDWDHGEFGGGGTESDFLNDLESIDWIGIYIHDGSTDAYDYGLDNFQLMVPEPAEYALAFSALAVTWLSVRKKRKKGVETSDATG